MAVPITIRLSAVIVAVTDEVPRVLTVRWDGPLPPAPAEAPTGGWGANGPPDALPYGTFDPKRDRTLDRALRAWVRERTGLALGYVEQLYTFGDRFRDPGELTGGPRVVSVAYLALVREDPSAALPEAHWRDIYRFFPWEDWRGGQPGVISRAIAPALERWVAAAEPGTPRRARRERADIAFGLGDAGWDGERVLERYELLYELGLVGERWRDRAYQLAAGRSADITPERPACDDGPLLGRTMAIDHRRILSSALGRLRGKLEYRPLVFELVPPTFTLLQLQRVVEALAGVRLHKGNFRRLVEKGRLVEGTGELHAETGGRPAELFRFRREVLRERKAPGVGLPGLPDDGA